MQRPLALSCSALVSIVCLSSGCAAMFDGTQDQVTFSSKPSGADIEIDGQHYTTPVSTKLSKKVHTVKYTHPDFPERTIVWERGFQWGYFWLDLFFTPGYGLVGFAVDGGTGAWLEHPAVIEYDFERQICNVNEVKAKSTPDAARDANAEPQEASATSAPTP